MTNELKRTNDTQSHQSSPNEPSGMGRDDHAERGRPTGPDGSNSPWYSPHTGRNLREVLMEHDLQTCQKRAKIYPSGLKIERVKTPFSAVAPLVGCVTDEDNKRGEIEGFSHEAARRLREWFMVQKVEGSSLWAITLTTHANFAPDEWRAVMKRFRNAVKFNGWAGCWRVELQKRKAPHAHVAFWLPPGVGLDDVSKLWLQSTGEENDLAARAHAVEGREIPADETGWAVYMGLHDGKHKAEQLGWKGKQWGIWNREAFSERKPVEFVLSDREWNLLLRLLRNWDASDRARREQARERWEDAEMIGKIKAFSGGVLPSCFAVIDPPLPAKPRPRVLHRGNLLRLLPGDFVEFVVASIVTGRIGTPEPARVERITREMLVARSA